MRLLSMILFLCAAVPAAAQRTGERSKGYAGPMPPGQISTALAALDCAKINRLPGLSAMTVPLSDECALVIPSPDRRFEARTRDGVLSILDRRSGEARRIRRFEQPVAFRWAADSRAFFLNDGEGSGQTSRLLYFRHAGRHWAGSRAFDRAAEAAYLKRYDCRGGRNSYANVSGIGWISPTRFRAIVTEGVHSAGCLYARDNQRVLLEVIGDPFTGRLTSVREVSSIDRTDVMAKLYFYYASMNAGKSTTLLQADFNYRERGMRTLLFTAGIHDRGGKGVIDSRLGINAAAIPFDEVTDLRRIAEDAHYEAPLACVLVDESQFLSAVQVRQLAHLADEVGIPVLCYGLRTDFQGRLFPGSAELLALADSLVEIKSVCECGRKATMNLRVDAAGNAVREGAQREVGGNERYVALCRKHFMQRTA